MAKQILSQIITRLTSTLLTTSHADVIMFLGFRLARLARLQLHAQFLRRIIKILQV